MDRGASPTFLTELEKEQNSPCFLVEVMLSTPVYMTDAWIPVVYDGKTFTANGHFLQLEGFQETSRVEINTTTITISGVDQAWISIALGENAYNQRIRVYKAFLNYAQVLLTTPVKVFEGRIDAIQIQESGQGLCSIGVTLINNYGDFSRIRGRLTNSVAQKKLFPGDEFFDSLPTLANKNIRWGWP
jgi:hypothetical protein